MSLVLSALKSLTAALRCPSGIRMLSSQGRQPAGSIVERYKKFKETQALRPDFDHSENPIPVTKSPNPDWQYGEGVPQEEGTLQPRHREIDPYATDRPMISNYRLLISGIVPRPIGFISTASKQQPDGSFLENLAPMSYFQVIDHDPPTFVVGFSSRPERPKDTIRNLQETGECVINVVSENMIEAVNAASVDAPYGVAEWDISGLHKASTTTVKPSRVRESILSVEGKLIDLKELGNHTKEGVSVATVVLVQATRFWVREDAVNEDGSHIDLSVLRPLAQLGGISYGRISSTFELPRPRWSDAVKEAPWLGELPGAKSDGGRGLKS